MNALKTLAFAAVAAVTALPVAAGLRDHQQINAGLLIIAIGDRIQDNCDSIEPRMVKAYLFAKNLENMAKKAGYSDDQIEEFVEDKAEKARVRAMADRYLAQRGVVKDQAQSYCAAGMQEIAGQSQIGVLLRSSE